jgi:hypothetical protein
MPLSSNATRTARWAWLCIGLLLASPAALLARIGEVATHNGHHFLGHVRLADDFISVIDVDAGQIDHVGLTNLQSLYFRDSAPAAPSALTPPVGPEITALPKPWLSLDVGTAPLPGTAFREAGVFRLRSPGPDRQERPEGFHFMYKLVSGDSEMVARVVQVRLRDASAPAGIMMRGDLEANAPGVFFGLARRGGVVESRDARGAPGVRLPQPDMRPPCWIKLKRVGNTFTAHASRSGERWRLAGEVTVPLAENIFVGLAVMTGPSEQPNYATFDQVQEAPSVRLISFDPRLNLASGSTVVGRIQSADSAVVQVYSALRHPAMATSKVASMLFRWLPAPLASKVAAGRPGVLLASGEFVEGDFRTIRNDRVTISSVLFGLRSYDLNSEVIAVVLAPAQPVRPRYRVKTVNGSILLGSRLALGWNEIELLEPLIGSWRFPISELKELEHVE